MCPIIKTGGFPPHRTEAARPQRCRAPSALKLAFSPHLQPEVSQPCSCFAALALVFIWSLSQTCFTGLRPVSVNPGSGLEAVALRLVFRPKCLAAELRNWQKVIWRFQKYWVLEIFCLRLLSFSKNSCFKRLEELCRGALVWGSVRPFASRTRVNEL